MRSIERAWGLRASDRPIGSVFTRHVRSSCPRRALDPQVRLSRTEPTSERNATRLIPASSHMLVSKIKPCMWFDSGEGARETATTSKEGSRRANYPIPTRGARSWTLGWVDRSTSRCAPVGSSLLPAIRSRP
ncbi:unnamed protein product [Prunus brigantina]